MKLSYFDGETVGGTPIDCPSGTTNPECYFYIDGDPVDYYDTHFSDEFIHHWNAYIIKVEQEVILEK